MKRKRKESWRGDENKEDKRLNEKKGEIIETKEQLEENIPGKRRELPRDLQNIVTVFIDRMDKACQKTSFHIRGESKEDTKEKRHESQGSQDQRNGWNVV